MKLARLIAALTFAALLSTSCGGEAGEGVPEQFTGVPLEAQDPGPVHVHGLGYDSSSQTLFIATHTGLFGLPSAAQKARRIGDSHQDTMGFTLVRPGLFLGSGHPDARANLPVHLGLIKSTDRGRSWESVSLLGKADFHVLRAHGETIYGYDSTSERLLASPDSGATWATRVVPEALIDLAVNPTDQSHLLASGGSTLYESRNGGRAWKAVATGIAGYLAWPSPNANLFGGSHRSVSQRARRSGTMATAAAPRISRRGSSGDRREHVVCRPP